MLNKIKYEIKAFKILLRSIPAVTVTLFVVSVICMNLLANKTLVQLDFFALDGGILISWLSFMCMDIITKHFGPRASNRISILAAAINLLSCVIFYVASIIPSNAADYSEFDRIFGGSRFILLGSTIAFLLSAILNNSLNYLIGKLFKNNPDGRLSYAVSTYVSTFVGQFFDNFVFSLLVFVVMAPHFWDGFHWTIPQAATCSLTGAVVELVMEIIFSPIGYKITKKWRSEQVGREYLEFISSKKGKNEK